MLDNEQDIVYNSFNDEDLTSQDELLEFAIPDSNHDTYY